MSEQTNPAEGAPDIHSKDSPQGADLRPGRREWLRQVDFWEGVKDFILRRIPPGSRPIDQLY